MDLILSERNLCLSVKSVREIEVANRTDNLAYMRQREMSEIKMSSRHLERGDVLSVVGFEVLFVGARPLRASSSIIACIFLL